MLKRISDINNSRFYIHSFTKFVDKYTHPSCNLIDRPIYTIYKRYEGWKNIGYCESMKQMYFSWDNSGYSKDTPFYARAHNVASKKKISEYFEERE